MSKISVAENTKELLIPARPSREKAPILVVIIAAMAKVFVADHPWADLEIETSILAPLGVEVVDGSELELERVQSTIDVLIVDRVHLDRVTLESLSRCIAVARYGVGIDTIDVGSATAMGIIVLHVPDYATEEVSTHTIAFILALLRAVHVYGESVRSGRWDIHAAQPRRSAGCRLGIVGFGRIGRSVASKAKGIGIEVSAYDPLVEDHEIVHAGVQTMTCLDDLLASVDIVSLHCPGAFSSQPLLGDAEFACMKDGAFLINTARGALVDEEALFRALVNGKLGGAALDVLMEEPPRTGHPLIELPNVIVTPHVGFQSSQAEDALRRGLTLDVARVLSGERPVNSVNPEVESRLIGGN